MLKKQTLPGSGQKGRPPWQAAVFRGGSLGYSGVYCKGREGCVASVREDWRLGKLPCCFSMPGHGPRPGGTAVAGGGPEEVSELVTWLGVFHEEEGGACPLSVSIKQYACHVYTDLSDKLVFCQRSPQKPSPPGWFSGQIRLRSFPDAMKPVSV